jgi:hypothetical protein
MDNYDFTKNLHNNLERLTLLKELVNCLYENNHDLENSNH